MYRECKLIDGVWMERFDPNGEWAPMKAADLEPTGRSAALRARVSELETALRDELMNHADNCTCSHCSLVFEVSNNQSVDV